VQPAAKDIVLYQGDDYSFFFRVRERVWDDFTNQWVPGNYVNLTNWSGKSQIRATASSGTILAEFTVVFPNQATTPGGVLLQLTDTQTAALVNPTAVWDVELVNTTNERRTFIAGIVTVIPEVTRA
jgi:hypothetical protein